MALTMKINLFFSIIYIYYSSAQRTTTIQLDGVQYYISRMNPYSPDLNYFSAYQYCRSLGLQLVSFETKEKADLMMKYLKNAGYADHDFWTSGNNLGSEIFLWMSTGLTFNSTFNYINKISQNIASDVLHGTEPQQVSRESIDNRTINSCVAMTSPNFIWTTMDCMLAKGFICEQNRCYYYNYGSIPDSANHGNRSLYINRSLFDSIISTTTAKINVANTINEEFTDISNIDKATKKGPNSNYSTKPMTTSSFTKKFLSAKPFEMFETPLSRKALKTKMKNNSKSHNYSSITSLSTNSSDKVFANHGVHRGISTVQTTSVSKVNVKDDLSTLMKPENITNFYEVPTVGPYDSSIQSYQADEGDTTFSQFLTGDNNADDDASTVIPEADTSYKYNIKVRNNGKVLDPLP